MNVRLIYHSQFPTQPDQLGGFWSTLGSIAGGIAGASAQAFGLPQWAVASIGTGGALAAGLLSQPAQSGVCLTGRVTQKDEMNRCTGYILSQLDVLVSNANAAGANLQTIRDTAQTLIATLSNDGYFKQDASGDTGRILAAAKTAAAAKLKAIDDKIAALTPPVTAGSAQDGTTAGTADGLPLSTVAMIGGGLLLLILILK